MQMTVDHKSACTKCRCICQRIVAKCNGMSIVHNMQALLHPLKVFQKIRASSKIVIMITDKQHFAAGEPLQNNLLSM